MADPGTIPTTTTTTSTPNTTTNSPSTTHHPSSSPLPPSDNIVPTIRLIPYITQSHNGLNFPIVERKIPNGKIIRVKRLVDKGNVDLSDAIAFKSKVVSRQHGELWTEGMNFFYRDTKSSSGTFINNVRVSAANSESSPVQLKDGDIIQLGVDYQGRTEDIFRCVRMRVELNRESFKYRNNAFRNQVIRALRALAAASDKDSTGTGDCCICLGAIAPFQALFIAPCCHSFHYKCVRPLLLSWPNFSCPLCRHFADLSVSVSIDDLSLLNINLDDVPVVCDNYTLTTRNNHQEGGSIVPITDSSSRNDNIPVLNSCSSTPCTIPSSDVSHVPLPSSLSSPSPNFIIESSPSLLPPHITMASLNESTSFVFNEISPILTDNNTPPPTTTNSNHPHPHPHHHIVTTSTSPNKLSNPPLLPGQFPSTSHSPPVILERVTSPFPGLSALESVLTESVASLTTTSVVSTDHLHLANGGGDQNPHHHDHHTDGEEMHIYSAVSQPNSNSSLSPDSGSTSGAGSLVCLNNDTSTTTTTTTTTNDHRSHSISVSASSAVSAVNSHPITS